MYLNKRSISFIALVMIILVSFSLSACSKSTDSKEGSKNETAQTSSEAPQEAPAPKPAESPKPADTPKETQPAPAKQDAVKMSPADAISTNFDDGKTDGWTVDASGGTAEIVDGNGGKYLRMERTEADASDNSTFVRIIKKFDTPINSGTVTLETKWMTESNTSSKNLAFFDSDGQWVASVVFSSESMTSGQKGGTPVVLLESFEPNKWYDVKMVVDLDKAKTDIYINGEKKADQIRFHTEGAKDIAIFEARMGTKLVGVSCVDDIKIY